MRAALRWLVLSLPLLVAGCDLPGREQAGLPTSAEARRYFERQGEPDSVALSGNVVEVRFRQPPGQLRRGGSLWARVGPYVHLFSPGTRELFEAYGGVAAVRVIIITPAGEEVARAQLRRDTLSDILWRRSLNILGHALREGTAQPSRLDELVAWGEEYAEYRYNPKYVPE
ncbi:MAG: hypothetical protein HY561_01675 [Gemmatimonadetes bacterium]|nr:hypothetical protein [Gemmatimonadota bacterium]